MGRPKKTLSAPAKIPAETSALSVNENTVEEIKIACKRVGLNLDKYLIAIYKALEAEKISIGPYGKNVEPDHDKRLKAALMGLELEGYIKNKAIATDNSKHTHVTYSWQPVQVINTIPDGGRINVD